MLALTILSFAMGEAPTVKGFVPPAPPAVKGFVAKPYATGLQTIPPGHHAHRKADGTVIVHADSNFGNAAAHAGIVWPWPKVGYAGQVVATKAVCPPGKP